MPRSSRAAMWSSHENHELLSPHENTRNPSPSEHGKAVHRYCSSYDMAGWPGGTPGWSGVDRWVQGEAVPDGCTGMGTGPGLPGLGTTGLRLPELGTTVLGNPGGDLTDTILARSGLYPAVRPCAGSVSPVLALSALCWLCQALCWLCLALCFRPCAGSVRPCAGSVWPCLACLALSDTQPSFLTSR